MKNVFLNRAAWMAGVSALVLLSACGGGGSGSNDERAQPTVWDASSAISAVRSIEINRIDGNPVDQNTILHVSEWTCEVSGERPLNGGAVVTETVSSASSSATLDDLRLPPTKLLVSVMNGNLIGGASMYYAKLHDMATAGGSSGQLTIRFDAAPGIATQFDDCP